MKNGLGGDLGGWGKCILSNLITDTLAESIEFAASVFDGFTVMDSDGYFRGRSVATMVIKLGTEDTEAVTSLARRLGALLAQQSVGHETGGRFHSITPD